MAKPSKVKAHLTCSKSKALSDSQPRFSKYKENPFGIHLRKIQVEFKMRSSLRGKLQVLKGQVTSKRRVHYSDAEETHYCRPTAKSGRTQKAQKPSDLRQKLNQRKFDQDTSATIPRCITWSPRPHQRGPTSIKAQKPQLGQLEDNRCCSLNRLK